MASDFESIMKKFLEEFDGKTDEDFSKEFMTLKSQSQKYKENNRYPVDSGQLSINRKKNRFKDILPFEYTRVELHPVEGVNGSDYINANYILGADGGISYIAAQGPLVNTVEDFWRMLWYHNIEVVVMACREVEMGKKKCEMYWPVVHQTAQHGAIQITTKNEENISNDFVVRDFSLECQGEKQSIRQYHYNAWPDHGKPDSPDPIIKMIEMINDYRKRTDVPLVIHCSAGCGRTGTLIGIDIARAQLLAKDAPSDFSVYKIVEKMRQQRPAMVQAKDQYSFVYMAIAELSRRSIGYNPTLPPKPPVKPATTGPPKKSYMNLDTSNPTGSSNHTPSPSYLPTNTNKPVTKSAAKIPPLPEKLSPEEHTYQNVSALSSASMSLSSLKSAGTTDDAKDESMTNREPPLVSHRPSPMQRSVSSTPASNSPPTPAETSKEEEKSQPHPMPKPRARSKKSNGSGVASSSSSSSSSSSPSSMIPPSSPTVQPPPVLSKNTPAPATPSRPPPTTTSTPKPGPPSVTPRVKVVSEDMPPKLPERLESPQPPSSPARKISTGGQVTIQPTADEDEFGYGLVTISSDTPKPALPKTPKASPPAPPAESGKTSLMDTFRDILGDELVQSIERQKTPPPLPPPNHMSPRKTTNHTTPSVVVRPLPARPIVSEPSTTSLELPDDAPPAVPCRTEARLELNDDLLAPTYEMPGAMTTMNQGGLAPPSMDYEQPTHLSKSMTASGTIQPAKSPSKEMSSLTTSSTFTRNSNTGTSVLGKGGIKLGSLFNKLNKKDSKKKTVSVEDLSSPAPVPKPASSSMSSSQSSLEKNIDEKYKFPGPLGFGIRVDRPVGPRDEPAHWKTVPIPSAIKVT